MNSQDRAVLLATTEILKKRFPNLTTAVVVGLAMDAVEAAIEKYKEEHPND